MSHVFNLFVDGNNIAIFYYNLEYLNDNILLQVGNAVPPPLARAIGDEIKKSLITVEHRNKCKHKALL